MELLGKLPLFHALWEMTTYDITSGKLSMFHLSYSCFFLSSFLEVFVCFLVEVDLTGLPHICKNSTKELGLVAHS
jgi:hypothetical protein